MHTKILWVIMITVVAVLFCTLPEDPSKDPDNATATFATIDGTVPVMPVAVTAGEVVEIALRLYLPAYITSIDVSIEAPGEEADTQTVLSGPWSDTLMNFNMTFPVAGTRWCIVTAHRSSGSSVSDTLTFTVTRRIESRPPVWSRDTIDFELLWNVRDSVDLREHVSDPDSEAVTLVADSVANNLGLWLKGTVLLSDPVCDTGTVFVNIIASDGSLCDTTVVRRRVSVPLIALHTDTAEVAKEGTLLMDVLNNDSVSMGVLTLAMVMGGRHGTATLEDNKLRYRADKGSEGIDTLLYMVTNGPDTGKVIITVGSARFFIVVDTVSIFVNGERKIDVLANDSVSFGSIVITSLFGGMEGNAELRDKAVYYHAHGITEGKDTVYYVVNNGRDTGMVIVTVLPAVVTVHADSAGLDEDADAVRIDVLDNDSISTGTMTLTWVSAGKLGEASIADNMVIYTAFPDSNGTDTVRYLINGAAEGVVVIVIRPVNDMPRVADTSLTAPEDSGLDVKLAGVDVDGDELVYRIVELPIHGTVSGDSSGNIVYTPYADFSGVDGFEYTANDGKASSWVAKVTITVQPRNDAPRIVRNAGLTVAEGGSVTIDSTSFSCSDPDDDSADITVTIACLPQNGRLERSGTEVHADDVFALPDFIAGEFTYIHDGGEATADSIRVTVSDGKETIPALIRITVTAVNDPPVFSKTGPQMKSSVGLGNIYRDTVDVFDAEGIYGDMSVSVAPSSLKYSFSKVTGRIVIDWCVDQRAYKVGATIPVTIEVKDGSESVKLAWPLTVGKHVWTKVAGDVKSYGVFAAVDSFVIFNAWIEHSAINIKKCDLASGGTWNNFAQTGLTSPGSLREFTINGGRLYSHTGELKGFNIVTGGMEDSTRAGEESYSISYIADDGVAYGAGIYGQEYIFSKNGTKVLSTGMIEEGYSVTYSDIAVVGRSTFLVKIQVDTARINPPMAYLERRNADCWGDDLLGCNIKTTSLGLSYGNRLVYDANDGDTLYVYDYSYHSGGNAVRVINAQSAEVSVEPLSMLSDKGSRSIMMLDGRTGFVIDSSGNLYSTNDGFSTLNDEGLENVDYIFISADRTAVFVLSEQDLNYQRNYYRY